MTREQELWAFAAALLKRHGERTPAIIAARIGEAALQNSGDQIEFWKMIAARVQSLMDGPRLVH